MSDFNLNDPIVEMFLFETSQLLEQLEQIILSSDAKNYYSQEEVNEAFRIMHTIKGSSAMMMYNEISALSHTTEDLFYYIREEKPRQNFCSSLNDLLLECVDFIKNELEKVQNRDSVDGDASNLIKRIEDFLMELKKNSEDVSKEQNDSELLNVFKAVIRFEEGCEMENVRAYAIIHNLEKYTDELIYYPKDIVENNETAEIIRHEGFQIYLKTHKSWDDIYEHLMETVFLKELELTEIDDEIFAIFSNKFDKEIIDESASKVSLQNTNDYKSSDEREGDSQINNNLFINIEKSKLEKEQKEHNSDNFNVSSTSSVISVSVEKLDKLMDLVGELVIAESMVLENPDLEGLQLDNFQKSARQLSKITNEIQDVVMSVRMVPLSATFQRMNRIVRDMCRKLNKDISLKIIGEETEVDKNIIERITDPLMHLVRNAVDHGIESIEERQKIGKPKQGTVILEAKNVGSDVHIIVKDDGRGLNKEKILIKAKEHGLLPLDEENMTDSEIYKLILLPGFSTKDNVTEYSGRGVGMDVVAKNIESIGGSISIDSENYKGTQITLKIPLTLAIIDGMNLKVGKSTFTIPTISVQETFKLKDEQVIVDPDGSEMILVRGECYPVLRLHKFFDIKTDTTNLSEGIIIMISQDDKVSCIFGDRLLGQQQVVVKSLPEYVKRFKEVKGIAGCTLLGDGSISLILDTSGLMHG